MIPDNSEEHQETRSERENRLRLLLKRLDEDAAEARTILLLQGITASALIAVIYSLIAPCLQPQNEKAIEIASVDSQKILKAVPVAPSKKQPLPHDESRLRGIRAIRQIVSSLIAPVL